MMEDDEKAMEAPDGPGPEFEEAQQQQQGAEGGDMVEQMIQAKNDRKRAESDVQLLANRLAHLKVRELNGPTRAAAPSPACMDVLRVAHAACAPPHPSSTDLLPLACICPNPPFVGKTYRTLEEERCTGNLASPCPLFLSPRPRPHPFLSFPPPPIPPA